MRAEFAEPLQQADRTYVLWRGRKLSYFGGCDYFRFSSHPEILRATRKALSDVGLNVAASRRTTGNHRLYDDLEVVAARFFGSRYALVGSSGYLANLIVAQGLAGRIKHLLIDQQAHASLRDAGVLLRCATTEFKHRDPGDLRRKLPIGVPREAVALLTDGMFGTTGLIAPLAEYREIIGPEAVLWVDDAHAAGILGAKGRGSIELAGITRRNVVQTVTFSKAFGSYGGGILCDPKLRSEIVRRSVALAGTTPIPLPLAAASLAALNLFEKTPEVLDRLLRNIQHFWSRLGIQPSHLTPVVPFVPRNPTDFSRKLLAAGIHPPRIQYPGGPPKGFFRFAVSSEHSLSQIESLADLVAISVKRDPRATRNWNIRALFPGLDA